MMLNVEDILGLAPDTFVAIDAQRLATPHKWSVLACNDTWAWGKSLDNQNVVVDRFGNSIMCSCQSKKICEHILGLLIMLIEHPTAFVPEDMPNYAQKFADEQTFLASKPATEEDIRRGLAYLDQWLANLIRQGLGEPHIRDYAFWDNMADRMLAAGMPGLSQWLRDIANLPVRGKNWVEPLLDDLSRLFLLVRSFDRWEELSEETHADICAAIGWQLPELNTALEWHDHWVVLGQRQRSLRNTVPEQHIWLYGLESKRVALLHDIGSPQIAKTAALTVGQIINAPLAYLPSRAPLEAVLAQPYDTVPWRQVNGIHIQDAITAFGNALGRNPWLKAYPMLLDDIYITRFDNGWIAQHEDRTYLPIASYFQHKWALYALSSGHPIQLAATWNGRVLYPLSANFMDLRMVINYK